MENYYTSIRVAVAVVLVVVHWQTSNGSSWLAIDNEWRHGCIPINLHIRHPSNDTLNMSAFLGGKTKLSTAQGISSQPHWWNMWARNISPLKYETIPKNISYRITANIVSIRIMHNDRLAGWLTDLLATTIHSYINIHIYMQSRNVRLYWLVYGRQQTIVEINNLYFSY